MIKLSKILKEIKMLGNVNPQIVRKLYWELYEKDKVVIQILMNYERYVNGGWMLGADILINRLPKDKLIELYKRLLQLK